MMLSTGSMQPPTISHDPRDTTLTGLDALTFACRHRECPILLASLLRPPRRITLDEAFWVARKGAYERLMVEVPSDG